MLSGQIGAKRRERPIGKSIHNDYPYQNGYSQRTKILYCVIMSIHYSEHILLSGVRLTIRYIDNTPRAEMQITDYGYTNSNSLTSTRKHIKRTDTEPFQPIINLSRMLAKHPVSLIAAGSSVPRCSEPSFIIQLPLDQFQPAEAATPTTKIIRKKKILLDH